MHTRACVLACVCARAWEFFALFKFVNKPNWFYFILWIVQLKQICQRGFRFFLN